jgi:CO/xanthine dehydrogenase FAD-binding subunit
MRFTTATTLDEVLTALADGARPVAGGSDLVVGARQGKAPLPEHLVAIDRIDDLRQIAAGPSGLVIGALVSHHVLEHHPLVLSHATGVADASALVGSPSTRNVGTIGGNVMNGSPAMDTGAPLVALGAAAELRSVRGSRQVLLTELWLGPGRTSAAPDELCVALHLPSTPERTGSAYVRLEYRRAMEIAVVGAGAAVTLADDGSLVALSVALTAVAPVILPVGGIDALVGRPVDEELLGEVAARASEQARPISDLRATDRYRRHTVGVMARRAVEAATRRARGEHLAVPVNRTLGIGAAS